jgi:carboxymethylenebutenolidase
VGYYGVGIEKALNEGNKSELALVLHVAGKDQYCPPEAQKTDSHGVGFKPAGNYSDYPEQDHAFGRAGGEHYDAGAAEIAHLRTLEFFVRHLAGAGIRRWPETPFPGMGRTTLNTNLPHVIPKTTLKTMVADAYVNHVPVLTGAWATMSFAILFTTFYSADAARYIDDTGLAHDRH